MLGSQQESEFLPRGTSETLMKGLPSEMWERARTRPGALRLKEPPSVRSDRGGVGAAFTEVWCWALASSDLETALLLTSRVHTFFFFNQEHFY